MNSTDSILKSVTEYYDQKLKSYGPNSRGVDWNSTESQELRFEQLLRIVNYSNGSSILDYGCGYGALLSYLNKKRFALKYSGFDASDSMIHSARKLFDQELIKWYTSQPIPTHDFVVASGLFNVRLQVSDSDWMDYILSILDQINGLSKIAFSFNMLTTYSDEDKQKGHLYYADPCWFFDYCKKKYSKSVALLHDYNLFEFTILVHKHSL